MTYKQNGTWGWVYETHRWFLPHILLPYLAYFLTRNVKTIVLVVYAWESIELFMKSEYGGYTLYIGNVTNESMEDSFIGDPFNAVVGALAGWWTCYVLKTPPLPRWTMTGFTKRMLMILSLVAHTVWMRWYEEERPIGYIITTVVLPPQVALICWGARSERKMDCHCLHACVLSRFCSTNQGHFFIPGVGFCVALLSRSPGLQSTPAFHRPP